MKKKYYILTLSLWVLLLGSFAQNKNLDIDQRVVDNDVQIPEDLDRNFDELLVDWKKELKSQSFDCDFNSNTNIDVPDSVYINRLYSLPAEMELVYNQVVRSYIDMYAGRRKTSVSYFLGKSQYYFPIFEKYLDQYGLPIELKYLPIIESALNPTIVSRAGATGLWQFMIGTGKMYDLEVNSLVDERRDPIKSSEAAAKYLKDLYNIYNDWTLVIAAYNCGPGNVNKAIKRSGGLTDYWQIYPYLPKETRGYVPAFIAAAYIMNYADKHNICPAQFEYTQSTDTIRVDKQLSMEQVSQVLNVSLDKLHELNPQYKKDIIPGGNKEYILKLPSIKAVEFVAQENNIYDENNQKLLAHRKVVDPAGIENQLNTSSYSNARLRYKVKRGDNLASIARKNRISVTQIKKWNKLKSNRISVGQVLAVGYKSVKKVDKETSTSAILASTTTTSTQDNSVNNAPSSGLLGEYFARVRDENQPNQDIVSNDNITTQNDDSIEDIVNEARDDLYTTRTIYHKIRDGESFDQIAHKYNISVKNLKFWNKIKSSKPNVGDRLVIYLPQSENTAISNNIAKQNENIFIYTVQKGDTLANITQKIGGVMTIDKIKEMNNLTSNKLNVGQKIKIPLS